MGKKTETNSSAKDARVAQPAGKKSKKRSSEKRSRSEEAAAVPEEPEVVAEVAAEATGSEEDESPASEATAATRFNKPARAAYSRGLVKVYNIPLFLEALDLKNWAGQFGDITRAVMCHHPKTGVRRPFGYVEFADPDSAKIFADKMTGTMMRGKALRLEYMPNMDRVRVSLLFHRNANPKMPEERAAENVKRRWTRYLHEGEEDTDLVMPCFGTRKMQHMGVVCNWKPFTSLAEALPPNFFTVATAP